MELAEIYWLQQAQQEHFESEVQELRNQGRISFNSKILTLGPVLDNTDGLLSVGGRLQLLESDDNRHPIILPKSSWITELIVIDMHQKMFHAGVTTILTRLRLRYWIVKGRQLVRTVMKRCNICKMLSARAASQPFAPIPRDRVSLSRPFDIVGIDFAGPAYIIGEASNRRKSYILLITCAAVRAVHLELTTDLTTESCLLALRRFFARRGIPSIIYSDNASTFKKTSIELKKLNYIIENEKFQGFMNNHQIRWKFIVERAPWWGGFWERLIKVTKDALKRAIGRAILNYEQLNTLLSEVENVVNNRPLTYVSEDPLDLNPLTPAHFIMPTAIDSVNDASGAGKTSEKLRQEWKKRTQILAKFKRRWFNEYFLQLRSLHHRNDAHSSKVSVGDIVLLIDRSLPRCLWHLAIIENVYPGRDGKIRSCEIRLGNGSKLRRPIQLLCPLELSNT